MRLYQSGALLTGARDELIPRGAVLVDGPRIIAAGPADTPMAEHPVPADVVDLGDVTLLPGLVDAHVHLGFDGGPGPVARMKAETGTEQLILMLRSCWFMDGECDTADDLQPDGPAASQDRRRLRQGHVHWPTSREQAFCSSAVPPCDCASATVTLSASAEPIPRPSTKRFSILHLLT